MRRYNDATGPIAAIRSEATPEVLRGFRGDLAALWERRFFPRPHRYTEFRWATRCWLVSISKFDENSNEHGVRVEVIAGRLAAWIEEALSLQCD